jgi:hypothetical protein
MKTKAGKKVLKDMAKDKKEILKDLEYLALELKNFKVIGNDKDQYLYGQLLARARSYKEQLDNAQGYVDTAIFLESFLGDK